MGGPPLPAGFVREAKLPNKFNFKTATALLGATVMMTGVIFVAPMPAAAQTQSYDGYCYVKKDDLAGKDAALGAIGGGIAGALLGKKGDKTKDAVVGAAVGGAAGFVIGKGSHQKVRCSKGRYYVYAHGYYDPPEAARGYKLVSFEERPDDNFDLYVLNKSGRPVRYHGR